MVRTSTRVSDIVRLEAPTKYRLTAMQILLIQHLWDSNNRPTVAAIARLACCSRPAVYRWHERDTTECAVGGGRPRTVLTPEALETLKQTVKEHGRKPMTHEQLRTKAARKGAKMSSSSLHRGKKMIGIKGKKGQKKPERAFFPVNREKRLTAAEERMKWSKSFVNGIVWIDESEGLRESARVFQVMADANGRYEIPMVPAADTKEEKVRFIIGFGNGNRFFHALPLRRAVKRDATGRAVYPRGKDRRKPKAAGVNAKLNKANQGETWTGDKLIQVVRRWLPQLKKATGVVLDNASPHIKLRAFLESKGVNVISHPPHSPDLNLAENVIQDLKRDAAVDGLPLTNPELRDRLGVAAKKHSKKRMNKHTASYKKRVEEIIARKGLPSRF